MEFLSKVQEQTYEKVGVWLREIFGESLFAREDVPSYVVRAGAVLVYVGILPWPGHSDSTVRVISFVARGPDTDSGLTDFLLRENDDFRFGAFALDGDGDVSFNYTMIGSTVTKDALRAAVAAVGGTADRYADQIVERWEGQTALDHLLTEAGPASTTGSGAGLDDRLSGLAPAVDRGTWGLDSSVGRDPVDCSVFAPSTAAPADSLLVQVFAHTPDRADEAHRTAEETDEDSRRAGGASLGTEIERGSVLTCELLMPALVVDDPVQELTWRGQTDSAVFEVSVPPSATPRSMVGRVLVSQASVPIGTIRFKLKIVAESQASPTTDLHSTGEAQRYRQAFISYASQDRAEVLRRVQMLDSVGISFFQDLLTLDPGERWERRLFESIDDSDVLFLFWSTAARESEWVGREWRYALETKGENFIHPVIIEGPPFPEPPPELAHLHFADRLQYFMAAS